jgi:hypothetical protein
MIKISKIMVLLGILSLVLASYAWAQPAGPGPGPGGPGPGAGMGGPGPGPGMGIQYDPNAVETVNGEVTQVQKAPGRSHGVHLQVKTDKETLIAILGPAAYLEQQKMEIAVGDKVEITGFRIKHPQQAILMAGELKKGDQVIKFRDEQGKPLWRMGPKRKLSTE